MRKNLLLCIILLAAVSAGALLIWQGFNWDFEESKKVLGDQSSGNLIAETQTSTSSAFLSENKFLVKKVFDGDTFQINFNGRDVSVRMIGIDTPETIDPRRPVGCFGKQASDETKRLLEGKEVILIKDISETDKYDRLLRYVYLPLSGNENLFINDYLVRQGFAKSSSYPPDIKFNDRFLQAEQEARENLRGLWGECK